MDIKLNNKECGKHIQCSDDFWCSKLCPIYKKLEKEQINEKENS